MINFATADQLIFSDRCLQRTSCKMPIRLLMPPTAKQPTPRLEHFWFKLLTSLLTGVHRLRILFRSRQSARIHGRRWRTINRTLWGSIPSFTE